MKQRTTAITKQPNNFQRNLKQRFRLNQKGQGLIEYLIIVAIMAVASISVMKVLSGNLRSQFANVANALGTNQSQKIESKQAGKTTYEDKDLSNFFQGSVNSSK